MRFYEIFEYKLGLLQNTWIKHRTSEKFKAISTEMRSGSGNNARNLYELRYITSLKRVTEKEEEEEEEDKKWRPFNL